VVGPADIVLSGGNSQIEGRTQAALIGLQNAPVLVKAGDGLLPTDPGQPALIFSGSSSGAPGGPILLISGDGATEAQDGEIVAQVGSDANATVLRLTPATQTTKAAGRLLSWDGAENVYVDPPSGGGTLQDAYDASSPPLVDVSGSSGPIVFRSGVDAVPALQTVTQLQNGVISHAAICSGGNGNTSIRATADGATNAALIIDAQGGAQPLIVNVSGASALAVQTDGRTALGASGADYVLPAARGSAGDVLTQLPAGDVAWTAPTTGAQVAVENFPIALATAQNIPWSGSGGGFGNLFLSAVIPTSTTSPIVEMGCYILQAPGGGGGVVLALYNRDGILLGRTALTVPTLGANVIPLATAPVALPGGTLCYLGIASNQNGMRVLGATGISGTPGGARPLGFSVPNVGSLNPNFAPPDISSFFGNQTTERFWVAAG
jgi:hypothetical protein